MFDALRLIGVCLIGLIVVNIGIWLRIRVLGNFSIRATKVGIQLGTAVVFIGVCYYIMIK